MKNDHKLLKQLTWITLAFILAFFVLADFCEILPGGTVHAQEEEAKTVRVGWYDSSFCHFDEFGRRCGLDYEYQQKIAAYTGWTYEYVEDSWSNLFQMLKDGEIDLLSDVSYKEERTQYMSFPDLPMGTESYYIYISADNRDISANDLESFNGKKIGVNKGSIQEGFLEDWAERNHLSIEVVPLDVEEDESMDMLMQGDLDGYTTVYTFDSEWKIVPVSRVGASDYFYAVNKSRPDLLAELNMALAGIQDEDPYFNQRISEERLYTTRTNAFLNPDQEDWLAQHGTIRIGYRNGSLPFCEADKVTGELNGALKDFIAHVVNSLRDSNIQFEAIPFSTTSDALAAMQSGEVDCVFPVYLSSYDADEMDLRLTSPAMKTEMNAVMRDSDQQDLSKDSTITLAVSDGDLNSETFIMDQYPGCTRKTFPGGPACFAAVASKDADCILVSNYRMPAMQDTMTKLDLYSIPTGESMPLSFAVGKDDRELYFILNKAVVLTDSEDMDSALASYMHIDRRVTIGQFMKDNWYYVVAFITIVFVVILILLLQRLKAVRRANEQEQALEEAEKIKDLKKIISSLLDNMPGMAFTKDAETGRYLACNQAFAEYAKKDSPDAVIGLTAEQLFDAGTAGHFLEDDQMALSMNEPYIFFEDVKDADGNERQFKTTKLKYTDDDGRLCVLGMREDETDMVRIQRENAMTREAYEKARSTGIIYTHIAQTLASDYTDMYYVNLDTEEYIEYRTDDEHGALTEFRRGYHFFESSRIEVNQYVYPADREKFVKAMDRHRLQEALSRRNTFFLNYRLLTEQGPRYVNMKVSRMVDDDRFIIIAVTDVDEQMKQREAAERVKEEQIAYARLRALAGDFLCIYSVIPETGEYREHSATSSFESFERSKAGRNFFVDSREAARKVLYPEDVARFLSVFTEDNIMAEIERQGIFMLSYRMLLADIPHYVQMRAALVEEKDGVRLIVGINDIDAHVRQEEEVEKRLAQAQREVNLDALTGVKNRHAYLEEEERLDRQIAEHRASPFAVVIFDVNDLKKINDTQGHKAGDQYLRDASNIICRIFKRSPVFRVGGDEFAAIIKGNDYECLEELIGKMKDHNAKAIHSNGIVIACGMSRYDNDQSVAPVFERADINMYENKSSLKAGDDVR